MQKFFLYESWKNKKITILNFLFFFITLFGSTNLGYCNELVVGTTFSSKSTSYLMKAWEKQPDSYPVSLLNRTSNSLSHLLSNEKAAEVDVIVSSSPMLFYGLQEKDLLATIPSDIQANKLFVPEMLQQTTVAFSISGYGVLVNTVLLANLNVPYPIDWQELANPNLQGQIIISSPTRSDTNHIMLEALLQKHGWDKGWKLINQIIANVGTISSRSFGVVDKINANLGAAGITIDNYANLLIKQNENEVSSLKFDYFDDFPVSPTFVAVAKNSTKKEQAFKFIEFLLSENGQKVLSNSEIGKYPIITMNVDNVLYEKQKFLLSQPQIDYDLLIKRQKMLKLLFEHFVTYRLKQLQENWQLLYKTEREIGHQLIESRYILTSVPVSEFQASDSAYLSSFDSRNVLLEWQQFFVTQQTAFLKSLDQYK